jgi:hypothetical protein
MKRILVIAVLTIFTAVTNAGPTTCSQEKDDLAEQALDKVQGWNSLHRAFVQYEDCDNGGTAERFSDLVVHLLASQWNNVNELAVLANKHGDFLQFVLHHINASASTDELEKVARYADTLCPQHAGSICKKIGAQAKSAVLESDKANQGHT